MTQADSVHSTPPTNTSNREGHVNGPEMAVDSISPELAIQQRERETTLLNLARLRKEARAEIHRLIDFLDASDPYAMNELESAADDDPCDEDELDGSGEVDDEEGGDEHEPSLGSTGGCTMPNDQTTWGRSNSTDMEDEHDGAEPEDDSEPTEDNEPSITVALSEVF